MQTVTNDNLLAQGIITDPVLYVENIPDNQIRGKSRLLRALKEQKDSGQLPEIHPSAKTKQAGDAQVSQQ